MLTLRLAWRLARGQRARVWLLIACIALGVCARVCVGSFSGALDRALTREARPLLGADVEIVSNQPLTPTQETDLQALLPAQARSAQQVRFTTMALAEVSGRARSVEVRAVDAVYPLYGNVVVAPGSLEQLYGSEAVTFVQAELLDQLSLSVGGSIRLGAESFRIAGVIREEPGQGSNMFAMGPRVLIACTRLSDTGLDGGGARLRYARLVALPEESLPRLVDALRQRWQLPEHIITGMGGRIENESGLGVRTAAQASSSSARIYQRVGDFLGIIALAALLLGGIGVASLVRGYLAEQRDTVAILQVLGATPRRVIVIFLWQSAMIGAVGGVIGAVAGSALENLLMILGRNFLPVAGDVGVDLPAMAWGIMLGFGVSISFAAVPLSGVHGMRPAVILRDDRANNGGRWRTAVLMALLLAAVMAVAAHETHSWRVGPMIVGVLVVGGMFTALIGWLVLKIPLRLARLTLGSRAFALRHGLGNLTRPGFRPLAAVVAIALAAQLLGTMASYRASLSAELSSGSNDLRPGWFILGLETDQVSDFTKMVRTTSDVEPLLSPMVMARLKGINGTNAQAENDVTPVAERDRFVRGREQRLSWRTSLGPDETIISGTWMSADTTMIEASLEQRFASNVGARLGDMLTLDIQGVLLQAKVTSLRSVRWANLRPNFFILLSPHALKDAPQSWIAAVPRMTDGRGATFVTKLATTYPNVTSFDIGELGEKLFVVIERIDLAVRFLGWFCLGAGILVLIGIGIGTGRQRRGDAALLAVLGGTRRTLAISISAEFATLGAIAGMGGLALGMVHARLGLTTMLDLRFVAPWTELGITLAAIIAISVLSGLAACRSVFTQHPLTILREE
jgi:putative ABC transport system permease protein